MSSDDGVSDDFLPQVRFGKFLDELAADGITQQRVAHRLGVSPQYICDCRAGRRRISELFARRLEAGFGRRHRWFIDSGAEPCHGDLGGAAPGEWRSFWIRLPLFADPIKGDPFVHSLWNGSVIEVSGPAAKQVRGAQQPYLLQLGLDDRRGRLRKSDLILISQSVAPAAEIQVLESSKGVFLARPKRHRGWEALSARRIVRGDPTVIGHCVGMVWAAL